MGDYLKLFETHAEYQTYEQSGDMLKPNVSYCEDNNCVHYNPIPYDYSQDYLTVEALEDNVEVSYHGGMGGYSVSVSTDNGETWSSGSSAITTILNTGEKLLIKGNNTLYYDDEGAASIYSSDQHIIYGNILSLVYGDNFGNYTELPNSQNIFNSFFRENTGLVSAENLILADNATSSCYRYMFMGCTSLVTPPELPATTLAQRCYSSMFDGCTSLISTPKLPATTLAEHCYGGMFDGCTTLTTAPMLPATTLATHCYNNMFHDCTSLTTAPSVLPATTLANQCYYYMFSGCTSLETAPELPAETLVVQCYYYMFSGCTSLNYVKCLATDISASNCTTSWLSVVSSNGTFVKAASMSSWTTGISGVPSGWTEVDAT